jgi:hypothetical protein
MGCEIEDAGVNDCGNRQMQNAAPVKYMPNFTRRTPCEIEVKIISRGKIVELKSIPETRNKYF